MLLCKACFRFRQTSCSNGQQVSFLVERNHFRVRDLPKTRTVLLLSPRTEEYDVRRGFARDRLNESPR